ncbi:MAG: 2'-5' RNA ligase family protein [Myxococcota bacterium]
MKPNWFVAFPYPEELELSEPPSSVRLFSFDDRHVTAAFLGPVDESTALAAWEMLELVHLDPISSTLGRCRMLGGRPPSAICAIVDVGFDGLCDRIQTLRAELKAHGLPGTDPRRPLPHVTLARIRRRAPSEDRRAARAWADALVFGHGTRIDELALYTWSRDRSLALFRKVRSRRLDGR